MSEAPAILRSRFDRLGILLSGLCAVHCITTLTLVAAFGLGGSLLLDPAIHRFGLAAAVVLGAIAIGLGVARHRRTEPLVVAGAGLALMAGALTVAHGPLEGGLTLTGVALVALAHWRNLRHLAR